MNGKQGQNLKEVLKKHLKVKLATLGKLLTECILLRYLIFLMCAGAIFMARFA